MGLKRKGVLVQVEVPERLNTMERLAEQMLGRMAEMLRVQQEQQEARMMELIQQQQNEVAARIQQLQQAIPGVSNHDATPESTISSASITGHLSKQGKHKMKVKLEYNHSDPTLYPAFESQLCAKLRIDGHLIGNEDEQVWYAFGCLKGTASARIHPWVKAYENQPSKFTKEELVKQMQRSFSDPEAKNKALQKLGYIKQGNRDFREFISEFDQTLLEAGAFGESETTKKSWLRNAISLEIAKAMVAVPEAGTYEEFCQQLHRVAHQLVSLSKRTALYNQQNRAASRPTNQANRQPPSISSQSQNTDTMDWEPTSNKRRAKWVSLEELNRRMKEGRCRRCGASGHLIKDCPYDPPKRPNSPPPKVANVKAAEPELEDKEGDAKNVQGKE